MRLSGDYWRFWSGAAVSNLGDGIRVTAFPLLAASLTREPLAVGAVGAATMLPWVVAGPFAGVLVDRADRRKVMLGGQLGRALVIGAFAWMVAGDMASLPLLYAVAFAVGVGEVVVDTSSQAAIPLLSPPGPEGLDVANSRLISAQVLLNEIAGGPVGGALFVLGASVPFGVDAGAALVAAALVASVRTPLQRRRPPRRGDMLREIGDGISFVRRSIALSRLAIAAAVVNAALSGAMGMLVLLALGDLGLTESGFGVLLGVGAVGGLVGSMAVRGPIRRFGRGRVLTASAATAAVAVGAVSVAPGAVAVAALQFTTMAAVMAFNVAGQSLRQAMTPDELLGRVVTSFRLVGMAGAPVGAVLGGLAGSLFGIRSTFAAAGLVGCVAAVLVASAGRHIPADRP